MRGPMVETSRTSGLAQPVSGSLVVHWFTAVTITTVATADKVASTTKMCFLAAVASGIPRSRCQQSRFLLSPPLWLARGHLPLVLTRSFLCVNLCLRLILFLFQSRAFVSMTVMVD